jgi:outer membrane receptor for ferrienterochelin and colicins
MQQPTRLLIGFMFALFPSAAAAQTGTIVGRVTDAVTGRPIAEARVEATVPGGLAQGATVSRAISDETGTFRVVNLEPGAYSLFVTRLGYQAQRLSVTVTGAGTASVDVALAEAPTQLSEIVTTASRRTEKVLDAPANVSVVTTQQVEEKPNVTVIDHVRDLPGIDVASGGLMQANTVARGFNNIFSGAMMTLTDNRFAFVPSLRVNVPYFLPETNEDIERIEVVLGPAAALYGPNTANGVLHVITRSPFTSEGTTLALDVGQQDIFRGAFRTAWAPNERFGAKISYQYFRADEFPTAPVDIDSAEVRAFLDASPAAVAARAAIGRTEWRDNRLRRAGGQVRLDFRPWENTEIVANYGRSVAMNAVEPTGLGAGQVRDWAYDTWQLRGRRDRLFAQLFLNKSDAGETFLLRTNQPIVDQSTQWVAQAQHGFALGRTDFIYGLDHQRTTPKTGGTITGRNEDDDDATETGGYIHGITRLAPRWDFVAAARLDNHSRVDETVFSPRLALVFKPGELQNVRLTFNRAFSQPTTNNLFLDLLAGRIPATGTQLFGVRALGVPESGLTFASCAGGFGQRCMRVPAPFAAIATATGTPNKANAAMDANAATLYRVAVEAAAAALPPSLLPLLRSLRPTPAQVTTQLRVLNPTAGTFRDVASTDLRDIPAIVPSITQAWELGHKGMFFNRLQVNWDVWHERRTNFVGPLIVETPNVFLDRPTLTTFLTGAFTAAGVPNPGPTAAAVATGLAGISESTDAATRGVPLAVVNFDHPLSASSDVILTYRNFGKLNVWGGDLAAEFLLDRGFTLGGTYSYVNKDFFSRAEVGGVSDISLNAPRTKGSARLQYRNELTGWGAELRGRTVASFPVTSGVWTDVRVESYNVMDLGFFWRPPALGGALWSVYAYNLLDNQHKEFAGGAQIGRVVMSRLQYTF